MYGYVIQDPVNWIDPDGKIRIRITKRDLYTIGGSAAAFGAWGAAAGALGGGLGAIPAGFAGAIGGAVTGAAACIGSNEGDHNLYDDVIVDIDLRSKKGNGK